MLRYAITDRRRFTATEPERRKRLLEHTARWAADGLDYIQLREKDLPRNELATLARELLFMLKTQSPDPSRRPRLLVNSRPDVAIAIDADGVHLTSAPGELTPAQVRRLYFAARLREPTVSVSCHALADVIAARDSQADLILFGPVFEKVIAGLEAPQTSETRISAGMGLALLAEACSAAAPLPVLALGGITADNISSCLQAGAAGIAAIRLFSV